ncbi:hypothetical protein [Flavobacterium fluvii]|nr:hypothetical protein [Flavobacterium fluvii]
MYSELKTQNKTRANLFQKTAILLLLLFGLSVQTYAQRTVEKLNRGLVAMRLNASQVYVGWRMLGTDLTDTSYNLYCDEVKLAGSPFTTSYIL